MKRLSFFAAGAALALASAAAPAQAATTLAVNSCAKYIEMAKASLPKTVSDPASLEKFQTAPFESFAFSKIDPAILLRVVGDDGVQEEISNCENGTEQKGKNYCDVNKIKRLQVKLQRGKLRYVNPDRSFIVGKSRANAMLDADASAAAQKILIGLGLPKSEISARPVVRTLTVSGNDPKQGSPMKPIAAEKHVLFPRIANGLYVFDSEAKLALDNKGQVARLSLQWPDAALTPLLRESKPRTPDQIAVDIAKQLVDVDRGCVGEYASMRSFVAYAPIDPRNSTLAPRTESDDAVNAQENAPRLYAPMIVTYVVPPTAPEDSGRVMPPGQQFLTPLFEVPSASDSLATTAARNPGLSDN